MAGTFNTTFVTEIILKLPESNKDVLYKQHKIIKGEKNKWSTMAGTFNTT